MKDEAKFKVNGGVAGSDMMPKMPIPHAPRPEAPLPPLIKEMIGSEEVTKGNWIRRLIELHNYTMEVSKWRRMNGNQRAIAHMQPDLFALMGLCGEVGELANLYKKIARGKHIPGVEVRHEVADVLSYIFIFAHELGLDIDEIASEKLEIYRQRCIEEVI